MTTRGRDLARCAALLLVCGVAACGSATPPAPPAPVPPTVVQLTVTAGPDVNPAQNGQGAPVVLRVYQLGSATNFGNAEFFQLFNGDAAFLGPDLLKREDMMLAPGQTRTSTLMPPDAVKALGFLAGVRDFQHSAWRGVADIPPHQTTAVTVTANRAGITVVAKPVPPPAPPPAKPGK